MLLRVIGFLSELGALLECPNNDGETNYYRGIWAYESSERMMATVTMEPTEDCADRLCIDGCALLATNVDEWFTSLSWPWHQADYRLRRWLSSSSGDTIQCGAAPVRVGLFQQPGT